VPRGFTKKDERQVLHIKESCRASGKPKAVCDRIAFATVNKRRRAEGRTMKKRLRGLHEFGEPITTGGMFLLGGLVGAVGYLMLRGGKTKKTWFAELVFEKQKSILSAVASTREEAAKQLEETVRIARLAAETTKTKIPAFVTSVYEDKAANVPAWLLWLKPAGSDTPILMMFFSDKNRSEAKSSMNKIIEEFKREDASGKMGPYSGGTMFYELARIPSKYTADIPGFQGLGLGGFSMKVPPGGVPAAFYKFTNPEEIIR
jgi:hypothetical protein